MTADGRDRRSAQSMAEVGREQINVALAMTDAVDLQMLSLGRELGAFARRQAGAKR